MREAHVPYHTLKQAGAVGTSKRYDTLKQPSAAGGQAIEMGRGPVLVVKVHYPVGYNQTQFSRQNDRADVGRERSESRPMVYPGYS